MDTAAARTAIADYHVLATYDRARILAGHDYGRGQRLDRMNRVWGGAYQAARTLGIDGPWEAANVLTTDEVEAAWQRVAKPAIRRIIRESHRRDTPATRATMSAWHRTAMRLFGNTDLAPTV